MKHVVQVAAITGIAVIEVVALLTGHDGTFFMLSVGSIGGIAGYGIGRERRRSAGSSGDPDADWADMTR